MKHKKSKRGIFIGIIMVVIILFLLLLKSCTDEKPSVNEPKQEEQQEEKEELIQLINLYDLLERADFCSKKWNEDAKEVVKEIEDLGASKSESSKKKDQEMGRILQQISTNLSRCIEKYSIENIDVLEKSLQEFEEMNGGIEHE